MQWNLGVVQRIDRELGEIASAVSLDPWQIRVADFDFGAAGTTERADAKFAPATEFASSVESDLGVAYSVSSDAVIGPRKR